MNVDIHPTPAVALGAYEVTPLEIAGAYTIFANHGIYSKPYFVSDIASDHGSHHVRQQAGASRCAGSARGVPDGSASGGSGAQRNGASVWGRGINFPVAGKTGTSHDGWFAGFTSKLICVVWVGFDDNRELNLEGAKSALPVWTEFMKRAHEHREYRNVSEFEAPAGVVGVQIDPAVRPACDGRVSQSSNRVFHRRNAAGGTVPTARRRRNARGGLGDRTTGPSHRIRRLAASPTGAPPQQRAAADGSAARPIPIQQPQRRPNIRGFWSAFGVYSSNLFSPKVIV